MHATTAILALLSTLAIAHPAPSEVNEDDLWGNCAHWTPCQDVVAIAKGCGTTKTEGGDVFSKPEWVECTCSQIKPKQLEDCSTVCLEYFREGGDLKKLKDACGY